MRCLADFSLTSDLCLPDGAAPVSLVAPDGSTLTISNAGSNEAEPTGVLSAQLVFDAHAFDAGLRTMALSRMGQMLNCLAFTTSRQFAVHFLKKIVDWTPGLTMRDAIVYAESDEWDMAEPALVPEYIDTASRFLAMHGGEAQHAAMRWYRLALQAKVMEEQFSYFWFGLEIVATTLKDKVKVASKCPHCHGPLFCKACDLEPTHRRYPGEAIQHLVEQIHPQDSKAVFGALQKIRHTLMHGSRIADIESELPCTGTQAVNKLCYITHQAIALLFDKPDPRGEDPEAEFTLGYVENICRRRIVGGMHVQVGMLPGDPQNPQIAEFPNVDVSVTSQPWSSDPPAGLAAGRVSTSP